jgi:hypothetical protein
MLTMAGCGGTPSPVGDQVEKVTDVATDLEHLAQKLPEAPGELLDDLRGLADKPPAMDKTQALVDALAAALDGTKLTVENAQPLAQLLFSVVNDPSASPGKYSNDLRDALTKVGAAPETIERVLSAQSALFPGSAS